jgi:hypothetical protein
MKTLRIRRQKIKRTRPCHSSYRVARATTRLPNALRGRSGDKDHVSTYLTPPLTT